MLGMHYASDEFAGADIEAFATQLRQYMPALHSLGMVEHVDGSMRDQYNQRGQVISASVRDGYLPVISVDSSDSEKQALLGTNLSSLEQIRVQLPFIVASGEALMVPIPSEWPVPGNTLILQPAYFGLSLPTTEEDREELYAGGIWMSIDLYDVLLKSSAQGRRGRRRRALMGVGRPSGARGPLRLYRPGLTGHCQQFMGYMTGKTVLNT